MEDTYRVTLEPFEGPLDLLLHLIREHEVDIHDISVATITDQYLAHLEGIERIDVEIAGEFLLMAATLMEIKSRMIALGEPDASPDRDRQSDEDDPRATLVAQLLEYKKYRDAADSLERRRNEWSSRYPIARAAIAEIDSRADALDLEDLHLNDLVEAFGQIMSSVNLERVGDHEITDDDTPIELHVEDLIDLLSRDATSAGLTLREIFTGRTKGQMIGLFIALLELVRQRRLAVTQTDAEIRVALNEQDVPDHDAPEQDEHDQSEPDAQARIPSDDADSSEASSSAFDAKL